MCFMLVGASNGNTGSWKKTRCPRPIAIFLGCGFLFSSAVEYKRSTLSLFYLKYELRSRGRGKGPRRMDGAIGKEG